MILGSPNAIDGASLLKDNNEYSCYSSDKYQFKHQVDSICQGDWISRQTAYEKVFLSIPTDMVQNIIALDDLRKRRNNKAHHFGRTKERYETPILLNPDPISSTSHEKLLDFFRVIYEVAVAIDVHLKDFIGSYDILLCYDYYENNNYFKGRTVGERAREFSKLMGSSGCKHVGKGFYKELLSYYYQV